MEFLKALQTAKEQHGMTKEEFMEIWERESKIALLTEETRKQTNQEQKNKNGSDDPFATSVLKGGTDLTTLTKSMLELKQSLQQKLNEMDQKLLQTNECLAGLQNQVLNKSGFAQEIQSLNSIMLWNMDSHSNSLKASFIQELQSLSQKFEGKLSCLDSLKSYVAEQLQCFKKDVELRLQNMENTRQEYKMTCGQHQVKSEGFTDMSENCPKEPEKLQQYPFNQHQPQPSDQIRQQQNAGQTLQPANKQQFAQQQQRVQIQPPQQERQGQELQQMMYINPATSLASKLETDITSRTPSNHSSANPVLKNGLEMNHTDMAMTDEQCMPRAAVTLANGTSSRNSSCSSSSSVVGTGPIAEIIASQLGGGGAGTSNALVPVPVRKPLTFAHAVVAFPRRRQQDLPQSNHTTMKKGGEEFKIEKAVEFVTSSRYFFTSYFYTSSKGSKVRLRLRFDGNGRPLVDVLVTDGIFDSQRNWPLVFSGTGYIYNIGSRRYTKLWEVEKQPCSRPEKGKEIELPANVCLCTSRGNYKNITYMDLALKKYDNNDALSFKWDLKAEESNPKHNDVLW